MAVIKNPVSSLIDQFNQAGDDVVLVFDKDDTMIESYPILVQMAANYVSFLSDRLSISEENAHKELKDILSVTYNVQIEAYKRHGIEIIDSLEVLHRPENLDLSGVSVDPKLKGILQAIPQKKYIFTNASSFYAEAVLDHLWLSECFDGVAGTDTLEHSVKPDAHCFTLFEKMFGLEDKTVHFFEDSTDNLEAAHQHKGWVGHLIEGYRRSPAFSSGSKQPHHIQTRLNSLVDLAKN